ncbi:TetR/AcrR family transcriptional regulator [Nocardia sp. NPDC004068]|uniref:TetR/AcrR family transcriptional regulator n=1 Tax=Nocardia sp. NPDC004068 TaxID=3364303 RepID=UPI0036C55659
MTVSSLTAWYRLPAVPSSRLAGGTPTVQRRDLSQEAACPRSAPGPRSAHNEIEIIGGHRRLRASVYPSNVARTQNKKETSAEAASKGAATRRRILDATAKILSRKGYAGTRLSDIADEAEMQAPAIYYYFDSREALIVEAIRYGSADTRQIVGSVLDALADDHSAMDRILVAVEVHLRNAMGISDYATASARNIGQLPDHLKAKPEEEQVKYGELWRRLITDAIAAGECRDGLDPTIAVILVLGALNYASEWFDPKRSSVDHIVSSAQSLVRFGLGGPKAEADRPLPVIGDPREWLRAQESTP